MQVKCNFVEGKWTKIDGKATIVPKEHGSFDKKQWCGKVTATTIIGAKVQAAIAIAKENGWKAAFVFDLDLDEQGQVSIWELHRETQDFYAKSMRGGSRDEY